MREEVEKVFRKVKGELKAVGVILKEQELPNILDTSKAISLKGRKK